MQKRLIAGLVLAAMILLTISGFSRYAGLKVPSSAGFLNLLENRRHSRRQYVSTGRGDFKKRATDSQPLGISPARQKPGCRSKNSPG